MLVVVVFFFSSRRRHTRCALVTGVQTCALPISEVQVLKEKIAATEETERALGERLDRMLAVLPNLPGPDVPDGPDESANVELRRVGEPRFFDFAPKEHYELGEALGLKDFEMAVQLSGARFVVLTGASARMERALANFLLDLTTTESRSEGHT